MKNLIIVRCGTTLPHVAEHFGEFENHFLSRLTPSPKQVHIIKATENPVYPSAIDTSHVLISGSHQNLTENAHWMQNLKEWINDIHKANIPLMGVCFGHQLIGEALGGKVDFNPNGDEYGIVEITMNTSKPVFKVKLPKKFMAYATHSQSIIELPKSGTSYAHSKAEPNQIVHYGNKTWSFQLHPEFTYEITNSYFQNMENTGSLGTTKQQAEAENWGQQILNSFLQY